MIQRDILKELNYDAILEEFEKNKVTWHRVRVRVKSADKLEETKSVLKRLGYTVWTVPDSSKN